MRNVWISKWEAETVPSNQCRVFVKQRPAVVCTLHLARLIITPQAKTLLKKCVIFHIMEARQARLRPGKDLRTEKLVGITLRLTSRNLFFSRLISFFFPLLFSSCFLLTRILSYYLPQSALFNNTLFPIWMLEYFSLHVFTLGKI